MKKLQILLLVLLGSVLAMPLYAAAALPAVNEHVLYHQQPVHDAAPVAILTESAVAAGNEAVLQLDNKPLLLPLLQQLLQQLFFSYTAKEPVTGTPCFALKQNGLHNILTAGP